MPAAITACFPVSSQRLLEDGAPRARKTNNNNPQYIECSEHAKYHHWLIQPCSDPMDSYYYAYFSYGGTDKLPLVPHLVMWNTRIYS